VYRAVDQFRQVIDVIVAAGSASVLDARRGHDELASRSGDVQIRQPPAPALPTTSRLATMKGTIDGWSPRRGRRGQRPIGSSTSRAPGRYDAGA
jgi:hypothetical protein